MDDLVPVDARSRIEMSVSDLDPRLKRLEKVDALAREPDHRFTELTNDESIDFALIEALTKSGVIDLSGVVCFFDLLKRNRGALDRKGVYEFIAAMNGLPRVEYNIPMDGQVNANPGTIYQENGNKPGLLDRLMFWKK